MKQRVAADRDESLPKLISITQAAARGIDRVRKPNWANRLDHVKIDIVDGHGVGPWLHLWSPLNWLVNGHDPFDFLWAVGPMKTDLDAAVFEAYTGPLPDSDEYKAASR